MELLCGYGSDDNKYIYSNYCIRDDKDEEPETTSKTKTTQSNNKVKSIS